jgi:ankyrin repeat protein
MSLRNNSSAGNNNKNKCPITQNTIVNGHSYTLPTVNGKHSHTYNIWALEEWVSRGQRSRITNPMTREPIDAATVQNIKDVAKAMRNLGHAPRRENGTRVALTANQLARVKAEAKSIADKRPAIDNSNYVLTSRQRHQRAVDARPRPPPLQRHRSDRSILDRQLLTVSASGFSTARLTVSSLIRSGANIEARNYDGHTPLIIASLIGHTDTVRILVDLGANIEARANIGWTALSYAAAKGHTETVRLLLDRGASIEAMDFHGLTALMVAAWKGHTETVNLLLDRGAAIEAMDDKGRTALMWAAREGHTVTVGLLLERGANVFARARARGAIFSSLFRRLTGRTGRRPSGTALELAARRGHTATVSLLREAERRGRGR